MTYEQLRKVEKEFSTYLSAKPFFISTKVKMVEELGEFALWVFYKKGMTSKTKREIATELGDIPLKWQEI